MAHEITYKAGNITIDGRLLTEDDMTNINKLVDHSRNLETRCDAFEKNMKILWIVVMIQSVGILVHGFIPIVNFYF